jgi:hypothetical protein
MSNPTDTQNDPYLEYLEKNQDKVVKALKEKINNLMKSDQKKKISILEKSVTDSEAELDKLKKLVNEYYFDEMNNNETKTTKLTALMDELKKLGEKYKNENDGTDNKEKLQDKEKAFGTSLDTLKDNMSDKSLKPNDVLKKFMEENKEQFEKLKLGTDIKNFETNISNLIKQLESKQK